MFKGCLIYYRNFGDTHMQVEKQVGKATEILIKDYLAEYYPCVRICSVSSAH